MDKMDESDLLAHKRPEPENGDEPPAKRVRSEQPDDPSTASSSSSSLRSLTAQGKECNDTADVAVREARVGITRFIGSSPGFDGMMKVRYTDFHVHEIDEDGRVVRLTDTTSVPADEAAGEDPAVSGGDDELKKAISDVVGEEQAARVWEFLENTPKEDQKSAKLRLEKVEDKDERTAIHKAFKLLKQSDTLPPVFTQTEDGCVVVCFEKNKKANNFKNAWPASRPQYLWFTICKENRDTSDCIRSLCNMLKKKPAAIQYGGTKDKRGVTTQLFSIQRVTAGRMKEINNGLGSNIAIGNYEYRDHPLHLGHLKGNRFDIVLRNVIGTEENIASSITELKERGFINYYGMQRFGTGPVSTDSVGLAILKNDWKGATDLILTPGRASAQALTYFHDTRNAAKAFDMLKRARGCSLELSILRGLMKAGDNAHQNALFQLPRNMRLMYVHSYQSRVWNLMVSKRLELFGDSPVVGDLVLSDASELNEVDDEVDPDENRSIAKVRALSAEDIASGKFSISDIVLPLPGFLISYPENQMKEEYRKLLAEDGLDMDNLKRSNRDFSLIGDYRKIIKHVSDLEWKVMRYNEVDSLIVSDLDVVHGRELPPPTPDGKFMAVVIGFNLQSSCYATMCLREAMKRSTTYSHSETKEHPSV